jgi:hypothetical protein
MPTHPSVWHLKPSQKCAFISNYCISLTETESLVYHYTLEDGNPGLHMLFFYYTKPTFLQLTRSSLFIHMWPLNILGGWCVLIIRALSKTLNLKNVRNSCLRLLLSSLPVSSLQSDKRYLLRNVKQHEVASLQVKICTQKTVYSLK